LGCIDNNFDFNQDFEIILNLVMPEIPWETQTLISNTSAFTGKLQSWKVDIDDGRLFFSWTNSNGEYRDRIGDFSLRSGLLIQEQGKISNTRPPLVSTSFLSQLTTAHNGFLTFFVEYGLLQGLLFFTILLYLVFSGLRKSYIKKILPLFLILFFFLIHNLTNDLLYSPDLMIVFTLILGLKESRIITNQEYF